MQYSEEYYPPSSYPSETTTPNPANTLEKAIDELRGYLSAEVDLEPSPSYAYGKEYVTNKEKQEYSETTTNDEGSSAYNKGLSAYGEDFPTYDSGPLDRDSPTYDGGPPDFGRESYPYGAGSRTYGRDSTFGRDFPFYGKEYYETYDRDYETYPKYNNFINEHVLSNDRLSDEEKESILRTIYGK